MNDDTIGLTVTFAAIAVVLPLALMHGTYKAQQVQEAWRKLADRHRLRFQPGRRVVGQTKVAGSVAGRSFLMQKWGSGNKATFRMELQLRGSLPDGIRLKPCGHLLATQLEVFGVPVSRVVGRSGEVRISDEVNVTATDPSEISAYLTPGRKRAAARLAEVGGELEDHKLSVTISQKADDLEELDKALCTLAVVAPILDTA